VVFHPAYHAVGQVFWSSGVLAVLTEPGSEVMCGAIAYLLDTIRVERPVSEGGIGGGQRKRATIVGGRVMFRGRAADRLTDGLPREPGDGFIECPYEDLRAPERVHVDCFGNVHFCQGLTIGSVWDTPFSRLLAEYRADSHPVCRPVPTTN
jgi:hypothetical protein